MSPVRKYGLDVLVHELHLVDGALKQPLTAYLLGGCGMSFLQLKAATKDIDLVLPNGEALDPLRRALREAGYKAMRNLGGPYPQLEADAFYGRDDGPQWDIYVERVCGFLTLSPGMMKRSKRVVEDLDRLRIMCCSPEDIFVFKSITDRPADRDDMETIFAGGIEWETVLGEMEWQRSNADRLWSPMFYQSMLEFAGNQPARVPILGDLQKMAESDLELKFGHRLTKPGKATPRKKS